MKSAGEDYNTESWSTILHMTEARLPGPRRESRHIATKTYRNNQAVTMRARTPMILLIENGKEVRRKGQINESVILFAIDIITECPILNE